MCSRWVSRGICAEIKDHLGFFSLSLFPVARDVLAVSRSALLPLPLYCQLMSDSRSFAVGNVLISRKNTA